jgi:hypothetical protein
VSLYRDYLWTSLAVKWHLCEVCFVLGCLFSKHIGCCGNDFPQGSAARRLAKLKFISENHNLLLYVVTRA